MPPFSSSVGERKLMTHFVVVYSVGFDRLFTGQSSSMVRIPQLPNLG